MASRHETWNAPCFSRIRTIKRDSCTQGSRQEPNNTMARILTFTTGPEDWRQFLADPQKHWRVGFSARTLAHCWEAADGFPEEVAAIFHGTDEPALTELEPLLAVPEFKVP